MAGQERAEEALREIEERYQSLVELCSAAVTIHREGKIVYANGTAAKLIGAASPEELIGRTMLDLVHKDYRETTQAKVQHRLKEGEQAVLCEEKFVRIDGQPLDVEVAASVIDWEGEQAVQVVFRNITERKALEEQLVHQTLHDPLTDLPNRALLMEHLKHALAKTKRQEGRFVALLFMDLDNLKVVNDSLGHDGGDQLLMAVAERLRGCLRPEDTLARMGGDEFAVLLEEVQEQIDATRVAERIAQILEDPFHIEGQEVFTGVSIGITLGDASEDGAEDLLRKTDIAMYRAKKAGMARYAVFEPSMSEDALKRLKLESELRRAVEWEEFRLHYQPKVLLERDRNVITDMEALVRWEHPERGLLAPADFLSVAEETGLIVPLGRWVIKEALKQVGHWQRRYPSNPPLRADVNLSSKQFRSPTLVQDIAQALEESGLDASCVDLEITETVAMEGSSSIERLKELKDLGVQISIDDFGTGYSSLSYLNRFPVNTLKIDKSFVADLKGDRNAALLVSAITHLGQAMGLKVIAEGVETAEQLSQVRRMGCDFAQGCYFAKPLPTEAAEALLEKGTLP